MGHPPAGEEYLRFIASLKNNIFGETKQEFSDVNFINFYSNLKMK